MLILLAAASLITSHPAPPSSPPCAPAADQAAAASRAGVRKLGELPPGQQIRAVWRFDENGCPKPVVVRARVGNR